MSEEDTTPVIQSIPPPPMIRGLAGEKEDAEPTPHPAPAPADTAESNTPQQTGSPTVAPARWVTLTDTTSPEIESSSSEIESDRDSIQAHSAIPGILAADDERETAAPTCPSPPPRPRGPINWADTYIDKQPIQISQTVAATEEDAQSHFMTVTVDKLKEEKDNLFVNIPLDLYEMKSEEGQEREAEERKVEDEEERWGFVCGFGWLERWWKRCTGSSPGQQNC